LEEQNNAPDRAHHDDDLCAEGWFGKLLEHGAGKLQLFVGFDSICCQYIMQPLANQSKVALYNIFLVYL